MFLLLTAHIHQISSHHQISCWLASTNSPLNIYSTLHCFLRTRITEYMDGRVQKFIERLEELGVAYESSGSAPWLLEALLGKVWRCLDPVAWCPPVCSFTYSMLCILQAVRIYLTIYIYICTLRIFECWEVFAASSIRHSKPWLFGAEVYFDIGAFQKLGCLTSW